MKASVFGAFGALNDLVEIPIEAERGAVEKSKRRDGHLHRAWRQLLLVRQIDRVGVPIGRQVVVGDLVFVCPPPGPVSIFGLERGPFRKGSCAGGAAPLIKTVGAAPGAHIEIGAAVAIHGVLLPRSRLSPSTLRDDRFRLGRVIVVPPGIAQRMEFCRAAASRAADCLIVLPPFPPEAHR